MSVKLTEWRLKMTDQVGSVLSKLNSAADKTASKMGGIQSKLNSGKFTEFTSEIPQAGRAMDLLGSRWALAGAGAFAAGALMYKSADLALDYETAMAKVNATAQLTPTALAALKSELVGIGEDSAGNFMRIPDAFEKINSQVNNVTKSLDILKIANKGAKAGFVDIDLAAGALAQTLSIVGERDTAEGIMDTLLKAKAVGAGEFEDFARYLPQLIASGDNLNIGHKDVAGLFSYMTAKGQSSSDSAMLLQNAFTAMGKSEIQGGFAKQGIHLFDKEGNVRDLGIFFKELQGKLGKFNAESKSNWLEAVGLKDAQAKNAFSVLAGDADKLLSVMDQVRASTGELNKQLDVTESKSRSWAEIGDKMKSWMLDIGDFLLPIVDRLIKGAEQLYQNAHEVDPSKMQVYKMQIDQKLSHEYAQEQFTKKHGFSLPEGGKHIPELAKNEVPDKERTVNLKYKTEYEELYNRNLAKLDGKSFGGDYDKWKKDQQDKLVPKKEEKKDLFHNDKKKKKHLKEGIDNINQGGQRIINVQFGKLNENIIIQPQTLKEGTAEVTLDLEEMLVRAIEGAEVSVANE
ncbi:phage tail tape measure protein [Aurantibacillus circumpalustris]|uniref:phage tail tape measure protein n=1 Tax=Aurantibacillus circumpalustris TaxID=3036359 RepID=UPI00295AF977|nr:phage tail tape measure protein [Aurantibacillus circumpalustris]